MAAIPTQILGYRLFGGELMNSIIAVCNNLTGNGTPQDVTAANQTFSGTLTVTPQLLAGAGATQGNATPITSQKALVTVSLTNSNHGVILPTAATGLEVEVGCAATHSVKVYPAVGGKIGAASTNVADTLLAPNKANRYLAVNKTFWVVQRGA